MLQNIKLPEFTIRDFIRPLFRQKIIFLVSAAIVLVVSYTGLLFQTPVYEATVLIHIKGMSQVAAPTYERIGAFRIHLTQMAIVESNPVIKRSVKALNLQNRPIDYEKQFCNPLKKRYIDFKLKKLRKKLKSLTPKEKRDFLLWRAMTMLKENIETRLRPHTDIFEIIARDFSPKSAIEKANVVSRSYSIYDQQQQLAELTQKYGELHPTIQQLRDNINRMIRNLHGRELADIEAMGTASVKIVEQATTDFQPRGRPKIVLMAISVLISLFVGFALALFFDFLNMTFKTPMDITRFLDIPLLGSVPKKKLRDRLIINDLSSSSRYCQFHQITAEQLFIKMKRDNLQTVLFFSIGHGDTKSGLVPNLGLFLARMGHKTLVIDANLQKPSLHKKFKVDEGKGLADMLEDKSLKAEETVSEVNENLSILQAGTITKNPTVYLKDAEINSLFTKIKKEYGAVLIDCTNLKNLTDAAVLSMHVDSAVVVVHEGKERIHVIVEALDNFKQNKVNIMGGILANRTFVIPGVVYKRI